MIVRSPYFTIGFTAGVSATSVAGSGGTTLPATPVSTPVTALTTIQALHALIWGRIAKSTDAPEKAITIRMFGEFVGKARFMVQVTVTESPVAAGQRPLGIPSPGPAPGPWAADVQRDLSRAMRGVTWDVGAGRGPSRLREYIAVARATPLAWVVVEGQADDPRQPAVVAGWAAELTGAVTSGSATSAFATAVKLIDSSELTDATALFHTGLPGGRGDPLELWIRVKPSRLATSTVAPVGAEQRWHKPRPYDSREEGWAGVPGGALGEEFEDPSVARLLNPESPYNHHKITNGITLRVGRCVGGHVSLR